MGWARPSMRSSGPTGLSPVVASKPSVPTSILPLLYTTHCALPRTVAQGMDWASISMARRHWVADCCLREPDPTAGDAASQHRHAAAYRQPGGRSGSSTTCHVQADLQMAKTFPQVLGVKSHEGHPSRRSDKGSRIEALYGVRPSLAWAK